MKCHNCGSVENLRIVWNDSAGYLIACEKCIYGDRKVIIEKTINDKKIKDLLLIQESLQKQLDVAHAKIANLEKNQENQELKEIKEKYKCSQINLIKMEKQKFEMQKEYERTFRQLNDKISGLDVQVKEFCSAVRQKEEQNHLLIVALDEKKKYIEALRKASYNPNHPPTITHLASIEELLKRGIEILEKNNPVPVIPVKVKSYYNCGQIDENKLCSISPLCNHNGHWKPKKVQVSELYVCQICKQIVEVRKRY